MSNHAGPKTRKSGKDSSGFFQNIGPWYMLRLRFFPHWLSDKVNFNIFIHLFLQSDLDVPHDHPWDSYSVILWGKIRERRQVDVIHPFNHAPLDYQEWETDQLPRWKLKFRDARYRHVILLDSKWALTIFIPLKKYRSWYFWPDGMPILWTTFLGLDVKETWND